MSTEQNDLKSFIEKWQDGPEQNKKGFLYLLESLESLDGVEITFKPREGVTYSVRGRHPEQKNRPLFVMVDVIEGEPRWLSVCFYGQMISDNEEKGDFVPQGLLGEDAICFDLEEYSEESLQYLKERMEEAHAKAMAGE